MDKNNNVLVFHDEINFNMLTKYSPNGQVRSQLPVGNLASIGNKAKMARIPSSGNFLGIFPNGDFVFINPNTLEMVLINSLRRVYVSTSSIYDVALGRYSNIGGNIQLSIAHFGDIAVYENGSRLYVFITAISARFPFVIRIEFNNGHHVRSEVAVASSHADMFTSEIPRGIAVNKYGTVLTTLPYRPSYFGYDAAVKFKYNFGSSNRPAYIFNRQAFSSQGMCTDKNGNFYVATGATGTVLAGSHSGTLLILNPGLTQVIGGLVFEGIFVNIGDVAVNPNGDTGYMVLTSHNRTLKFSTSGLLFSSNRNVGADVQALLANPDPETGEDAISALPLEDPSGDGYLLPDRNPDQTTAAQTTAAGQDQPVDIKVYPNPTQDWATVETPAEYRSDYSIRLTCAAGKTVLARKGLAEGPLAERLDLSALPAGVYYLHVAVGGQSWSRPVVKR